MSELLSEHMERVQGPASYWVTDVQRLETANAELLEALENIRDTARTGLPISSMTQEQYDVHRLIAIAGRADYAIRKHKGE